MKLRYSLILSFVITLSTFANEPKEGLLWRISGNGLAQPSYLFGTWHGDTELRNHSFLDSVPGFHKAFNSTHQYIGEINLLAKQPKIQHISEKIFLPKDTLYSDLLDQKDLSKLDTFLTKKLRTNSSKVNLRPGMLQYMLAELIMEDTVRSRIRQKVIMLESATNIPDSVVIARREQLYTEQDKMDVYLLKKANERKEELFGLDELIEFQALDIFTDNTSLKEEADSLISCITNMETHSFVDSLNNMTLPMRNAYREQDINKVKEEKQKQVDKLSAFSKNMENKAPDLMQSISVDRNKKWMNHIPTYIANKSTFIAVGALHLPGKDGLINLLREAGYIVEQVE